MKFVAMAVFFGIITLFLRFVFKVLKAHVARVFPEDYAALKKKYPSPLHKWIWLSGTLSTKYTFPPFQFKGTLKIEVYQDQLIVSSCGQGLCLPYDKCTFKQKKILFLNHLVVENVPVNEYKDSVSIGAVDFGETTTLTVGLSAKKINTILALVQRKGAEAAPAQNA